MRSTKIKISILGLAIATSAMLFQSCNATKTQKGAAIGGVTGGVIGAIIGKQAGNTAVGAIIGGAIGGTAGAFIGRKMDRQAEELKQTIPNAEIIREGEGIIVKFDSGILFDVNKADLKSAGVNNVQNLSASLKKNPETNILIIGHTDDTGSGDLNDKLSYQRAQSVKSYAMAQGISSSRLDTKGKGENEPIADNSTETGRAQNRRVEIVIVANNKMKEEAKNSN